MKNLFCHFLWVISDKVFWCGWVFRRKLAIVLALLSFSVTRTCIAETLIKLLVVPFLCLWLDYSCQLVSVLIEAQLVWKSANLLSWRMSCTIGSTVMVITALTTIAQQLISVCKHYGIDALSSNQASGRFYQWEINFHPGCLCTKGRHHLKKTVFFSEFIQTSETPPPINLDGLIFSVNRNFGSGRTPPLRDEINPKKFQSFSVNRNFGLGQTPPSPFWINSEIKKYFFMSKKKYFEKLKKKLSIWWKNRVFDDKNQYFMIKTLLE